MQSMVYTVILVVLKKMGEFLLDEKGNSNVISNLSVAKYYVREISAPKGYAKK